MMAKTDERQTVRERRVARVLFRAVVSVLTIGTLALGSGYLGHLRGSDFWTGFSFGLLTGLPCGLLILAYRGYRTLDEYGKLNLLRASTVAFASVMLTAMTYYPLEQALKLPAMPLWILWVVGWSVWSLTFAVLNHKGEQ